MLCKRIFTMSIINCYLQSHESIWERLDQCDVEKDIQHFIENHGTGGHIPGMSENASQKSVYFLLSPLYVEPPAYVDFFSESRDEQPKYSIANFTGRSNSKRLSSSNLQPSKSDQESKRSSSQSMHRTSSTRLSSSIERESRHLSNGGDEEIFIEDSAQGVIVPIVTKKSSSQMQSLESSRAMTQSSDDVFHTTERANVHEKGDADPSSHSNQKQSFVSRLSRKLSQNIDRSFDHAIEGLIYKMEKGRESNDIEYSPTKTTGRSNSYREPPSPVKNSSSSSASKGVRPTSPYVPGGWPNGEPKVSLSTSAKILSSRSGAIQSPSPSYSTGTAIGTKVSTSDNHDPRGSIKMHAPPAMRRPAPQQAMVPQPPPSEEKQVASHDGGEPILCWGKQSIHGTVNHIPTSN